MSQTSPTRGNGTQPAEFGELPARDVDAGAESTLARVRELLFGEAVKAQESRTAALEARARADVERVEKALQSRLKALEDDFEERVEAMREEMSERVTKEVRRLEEQLERHGTDKVERADLRGLLSDLADRIGGLGASPPSEPERGKS